MYLARIVGRVWATAKNENLEGVGLRVIKPLTVRDDSVLAEAGEPLVAADPFHLGEGEVVWVEGGREAAYGLPTRYGPSDATIVAKADSVDAPAAPERVRA